MIYCDQATEAFIEIFDLQNRLYIRHNVCLLFPLTAFNQLLFRLINKNSQDNHRAYGNELPERINSQKYHAILDDIDIQYAYHYAVLGSLTTEERCIYE